MLDHLSRGTINLEKVRYVVLDEADRMLDIGFRPQIERIMRRAADRRQTLMMSATLPADVMKLVDRYMIDPEHVNMSPTRPDGREDRAEVHHRGRGPEDRTAAQGARAARSRGSASSSSSASAGPTGCTADLKAHPR